MKFKNRIIFSFVSISLLSLIPISIDNYLRYKKCEIEEDIFTSKSKINDLEVAFQRILKSIRFQQIINVSDLNISQDQVKNIYAYVVNNLTPLFPYLPAPQRNMPKNFFGNSQLKWDGTVDARVREFDLNETIKVSNQMANQIYLIMKYIPKTNNINDYIYWIYTFVSNWISYNSHGLNNKLFSNALINKTGVCEAYAKMTQFFFNVFGINSIYQTGNLKSGEAAGDHIWNKYNINNNWFNFDTTSAATFNKAYYLMPVGNFLSFNDNDFSNKRTQYETWYETSKTANFDTSLLVNYVPYNQNLKNKKWVYNNKWYYLEHQTMNVIESNIDNTDLKIITKINRTFNQNYIQANNIYLVGNSLYWVDKVNNQFSISEYNLDNKILNSKYYIFSDEFSNKELTSTKLNNINQLEVTFYDNNTYSISKEIVTLNQNYNFFENNNSYFAQRALSAILSLYFIQFDIGNNINQFKNENDYLKYQWILINGLTLKEYNDDLFNNLLNFKSNLEQNINKDSIPLVDVTIDEKVTFYKKQNLTITPTITIENAEKYNLKYQWKQSDDGENWINIENQTNENLDINNVSINWNNKKIKLELTIEVNGYTNVINSNICNISIKEPSINLTYESSNIDNNWNANDNITFSVKTFPENNFNSISLYKKTNDKIELITNNLVNVFNYKINSNDLLKRVEFYVLGEYFGEKIKSNIININFNHRITQMINDKDTNTISNLGVNSEFKLSLKSDINNLNYQWNFDEQYFKIIGKDPVSNIIKLKVIKTDNQPQKIICNVRNSGIDLNFEYIINFIPNTQPPLTPDNKPSNNNNKNKFAIIIGSILGTIVLIGIIALILIICIRKRKK